ncbi:hypothetical protein KL86DYS1_30033 [uncultured Dysgonomonas sp.]|uniref:Uncharacterized protein n=1 Tax=uncultured Dysgonomonas sp. TaxID=206096 RepID=A0A212JDE7_9BACT|nr:hypothetical protein KL86DYS1_11903 [uncultured Dysgonomonas sp.]SBW01610.1 hypothetical protein KL86DYS1_30033 [uncultured Dysgonomonas sp.]
MLFFVGVPLWVPAFSNTGQPQGIAPTASEKVTHVTTFTVNSQQLTTCIFFQKVTTNGHRSKAYVKLTQRAINN